MSTESEGVLSRKALVLFGTETGTAQDLAYEVNRLTERYHFETEVDSLNSCSPQALSRYDLVILVLSTTGQGDFPSNAGKFWLNLRRKKLTSTFLSGVNYALIGLGDSSYPKFNYAARLLHKRLGQLGAVSLLEPCEADEQGEDSTDGAFIAWVQSFRSMIMAQFPLAPGLHPVPDGTALPSKWVLAPVSDHKEVNGHSGQMGLQHRSNGQGQRAEQTFQVTLEKNQRVTPASHWQDVRFMRLLTDRTVQYYPGDALAIQPKNMTEDVQDLISLMKWEDVSDVKLRLKYNRQTAQTALAPDIFLSANQEPTLRQLLQNVLDINAIPRRSFFAAIAQYSDNDMHKERLLEFTDPQYLDEYYDYATRPRRSIIEILQEFDSVKIPWQEAINVFPMLRPRQFSVASGGELKQDGRAIELIVAIVKYKTVIKRVREGVCTRYLAQLPVGANFDVTLKTEGRLQDPDQIAATDHLLVGAGTGIAPLRSIIYEKQNRDSFASTKLIFGCRNAHADYFFQDEWIQIAKERSGSSQSPFEVVTAFSRDQKQKVYVQDRIRDNARDVRDLLSNPNTTIVVCGSSGPMPKAIRQAFIDVLSQDEDVDGKLTTFSPDEAEKFLAKLEKTGRYKQETW